MSASGKPPAGLRGCGNELPEETWNPSTPGLLEPPADLDRVLDRRPLAPPGKEGVVVVDGGDLELDVVVVTDLAPDRLHDLERQPRAVLQRAAVLVLAVVDRRREELRDQVAVAPVDLDPVELGLARAPRGLREALDDLPDLRDRRPLARQPVDRLRLVRRAEALRVRDARDVALAAGVRDLGQVLAAVLARLPCRARARTGSCRRRRGARSSGRSARADAPACSRR